MHPATERRVLVYHSGVRSVVNLSGTWASSSPSPSCLPSSKLWAPLQGRGPRDEARVVGSAATAAAEQSALDLPCSLLALQPVRAQEDACSLERALIHTTPSPAPKQPLPSSPARCAPTEMGDAPDSHKQTGTEGLSKQTGQHSLQGVSPSPFADGAERHGGSGPLPGRECRMSPFAESPPASVAASSPVLLWRSQGGSRTSVRCDACQVVPDVETCDAAADDDEAGQVVAEPPLESTSAFLTHIVESLRYTDPSREVCGEDDGAVAALGEKSKGRPLSPLLASSRSSEMTPNPATGAERVLFGDGDELMDISTASRRCRTPEPDLQATTAVPCAAADAVAHTPPRLCTGGLRAPLFPTSSDTGTCESADCSSQENFSINYAAALVCCVATPSAPVPSAADAAGAAEELLDAKEPGSFVPVIECLPARNVKNDAEKVTPMPKGDRVECAPCALTASRRAGGHLSSCKSPTASPLRQELHPRLLTTHGASATHTPTARTCSSASSLPNGAALSTPTPLHASQRWRGSSATPGWESLAQITGFPTPVKLSPIPTKGYSASPNAFTTAAAAAEAATRTSTPHVSASSSPALSAIEGDDAGYSGDKRGALTLPAATGNLGGAVHLCAVTGQRAEISGLDGRAISLQRASDSADYLSSGRSISTISSACSASPSCARAGQTTRVWTPQPSEVSQQRQYLLLPSSPVEGHSSRFLSDFSSSTGVQPPTLPQQQRSSLRNSTMCGTADTCRWDHAFSAHSNPSRPVPRCNHAAKEGSEDLTAIPGMLTGPQAQPLYWQPQRLLCLDYPTVDLALMHRSTDRSTGERANSHLATETLNLGTPTVSMIRSPLQALGESCCSLFMPQATQYIQALPIPGLRRRIPSVSRAAQPVVLVEEGVGCEGGCMAPSHEASRNQRRETQRPALMSPALDDEEGSWVPRSSAVPTRAELPLSRPLAPPPTSPNASHSLHVQQPRLLEPKEAPGGVNCRTGTSICSRLRPFAGHEDSGRLNRSVPRIPPLRSSLESQLPRSSSSKVSAIPSQACRQPHLGLSSAKDASRSAEASYVRCHPTVAIPLQSSTYFIDSWL
ncbi:hypothetical protein LSCM1_02240 [Leishmania martiniquensis]|uniref:Uncharacterized protein n=1 Tax=Leishmania martiniquensis TaxID=1580590 RepID=A0A836KDB4_9TRYP|nr:hypothetical protein LSCM1_02240 [Leishmania martiniquensis]